MHLIQIWKVGMGRQISLNLLAQHGPMSQTLLFYFGFGHLVLLVIDWKGKMEYGIFRFRTSTQWICVLKELSQRLLGLVNQT